ncbi:MAG: cell division protein FtsZ [Candidatus Nanoarchaeia archaeon]|nr:cell division protein FtsZ [Candidatus Haiyanarchaeum thermophilum]MCW1303271.1 cell division protein FtsZ [Candidatus Haiyanarchaeum thermophilum]MCW1303998.1 cell division protein FtsZ [Candidatus Haiyanarchaeum thermophilum]MCW1306430.1 cell division protein FtsZ [Candidatus Haiyanarchaeum thermophilum]MCW1307272.1 cell division protein FtsZ [Candidatus Haiyanarchaeum thermophilum]
MERFEIGTTAGIKVPRPELSKAREVDAQLEQLIKGRRTAIKVVGVGGAGNNTITRMSEVGIKGAELIAVNTDAVDLLCAVADKKILIGKELTGGLGAGSDPKIGREAARESEQEIKQALQGADMVFITCGLGGGTGTGAAPVIAEISKKMGILTVAVVTLPFNVEGRTRIENAMEGLEALQAVVDTLIVIPNEKLLEIASDLPLPTAFKIADEILTNAVKGITELVTKPGLVNRDFADIKAIMKEGGVAMIGVGESDSENRAIEAIEKAINNPLLDVNIDGARGALVYVMGGSSLKLDEVRRVCEEVSKRLDVNSKMIWGAQISPDLQDTLRVLLIVTGVKSPQIFGREKPVMEEYRKGLEEELGIKFLE